MCQGDEILCRLVEDWASERLTNPYPRLTRARGTGGNGGLETREIKYSDLEIEIHRFSLRVQLSENVYLVVF